MIRIRILTLLFAFTTILFWSGTEKSKFPVKPPYLVNTENAWVDSVLNSLTMEERLGQLFMVPAYSNELAGNTNEILKLIEKNNIGGILFFQGNPVNQAKLANQFQSRSKVPLLMVMDAEYGLAMRLDNTIAYPRQMALGAIQNDSLLEVMGSDLAEQMKMVGLHVNLAPVVDINVNPNNPVINSRSFSENKELVADKALRIMTGLQKNNVIATAKHFPGHGNTNVDSHESLPIINLTKKRLKEVEFFPFKKLIDHGIGGVMIAHLYVPALDPKDKMASTLSEKIVKGVLQKELGFEGLIYTDALNMKGISESNRKGDIDMEALLAGNDILLFPEDVPKGVKKIKKAIKEGFISEKEINSRVRKILLAKYWVGLSDKQLLDTLNLNDKLNANQFKLTRNELVKTSITLLKNKANSLPIKDLSKKMVTVSIGSDTLTTFQKSVALYADVEHYNLPLEFAIEQESRVLKSIKEADVVFVGIHSQKDSPALGWGLNNQAVNFVNVLRINHKVICSVFANPYSLRYFNDLTEIDGLLMAYQNGPLFQQYAAEAIFGGITVSGKLPVTASDFYKFGDGLEINESIRFSYSLPEEVSINSKELEKIDSLANWGIEQRAYPGCQILVAKNQKVIYSKSFGHHTYEEKRSVELDDLYDLASITKIASSVASFMKLEQNQQASLDYNLCDYLPELVQGTPYFSMNIREMLAHQAGLVSWIPFYKSTLIGGEPRFRVYSIVPSVTFPYRVSEGLYIHKNYPDSIMKIILNTDLVNQGKYKYSDLGYYFMRMIVEQQAETRIDSFASKNYYQPLGMATTGYLPRNKFELDRIIPTEYDLMFRKSQVHGDVHDPGAAMMGGIGGHAGLFSSANDLAKLMQMFVNAGTYGGVKYLDKELVEEYTKCQFCENDNRRGAGFDKPVRDGYGGPTSDGVSLKSFGHSGFTGTLAWADPDEDLVYVFLSNRVYPSASNKKLIKLGIRTEIMEVIYDAVENAKTNQPTQTTMK